MSLYPTRTGVVENCRPRDTGYVISVRTAPYLVEHFHHDAALTIGASVTIHQRDNTYTLTVNVAAE
jgi:hypothetical protein